MEASRSRPPVRIMEGMPHELIGAVAFDAVGTLIHPDPPAAEVYAAVGRRFGSRIDLDDIRRRFRVAFVEQEQVDAANGFAVSEERERRRWQAIVAAVLDDVAEPAACFAQLYEHFARPEAWRCEDGAAELFARIRHAGYAIALASNYDHRLRRVLAGLEALAPIATVVISSEVGWRKPAPGFFGRLAEALALPPERIVYVGDDYANDFVGAGQAGLHALLFDPHGWHPELGERRLGKLGDLRLPGMA